MTSPELDKLKAEFAELKTAISQFRKKGKDMFIAQLKIMNIPSKLKMVEATQSKKDIAAVRSLIADAWKELTVEVVSKESFKKTSGVFEQVSNYLAQSKKALREGDKAGAKRLYREISKRFPALNHEQKKIVLADCRQLINELS